MNITQLFKFFDDILTPVTKQIAEDMGYTSQDNDNDTGECVEDEAQAASLNVRGKRAASSYLLTNNEVTESDVQSEVNSL